MKIVTVVGARPQFIKAAAVSRAIRPQIEEILVHTGQHYDQNMSDIFFNELHIPTPDYNLGVGSGSHAKQTGEMMVKIEEILLSEKPDMALIYGDTNSTLAAAIAAVKIHIPVAHVEAGLRSYNMLMPEEINRILSDRISTMLFCPTNTAVENLKNEGITKNVFNVGDVMCDTVIYYSKLIEQYDESFCLNRLVKIINDVALPKKWYLATIHRAENTDDISKIEQILCAFEQLPETVIFPVHPRSKKLVGELQQKHNYKNILFCEPMGYLDMLYFTKNAVKVVTDSGGLQKEAYILDTTCVTVRDQTEWVETLIGNNNILASPKATDILDKVLNTKVDKLLKQNYYGDGDAANRICKILLR
ncbi:MAG: UDP-N-acetylglucosamine 2-epimerase (non-hydrolyzing) [Clostridia bacterium]